MTRYSDRRPRSARDSYNNRPAPSRLAGRTGALVHVPAALAATAAAICLMLVVTACGSGAANPSNTARTSGSATSSSATSVSQSASAGEAALAYAHAFGRGEYELACKYMSADFAERAAQVSTEDNRPVSCGELIKSTYEKVEEEGTADPWVRKDFASATLLREVAVPEGEAVYLAAPASQKIPPEDLLMQREGTTGPWRYSGEGPSAGTQQSG